MQQIDDIIAQLEALKAEMKKATEVRLRNVSKTAKNIKHGEIVDLPGWGLVEVSVWVMMDGHVTLGAPNKTASVPADQRLHVRRNHGAG